MQRFSVSIELSQALAFPLIVFCFYRLPNDRALRLPASLAALALCGWFVASLNIYGYLPSWSDRSVVYLSRLDKDPEEKLGRELLLRYTTIAKAYDLPRMELVLRSFADIADSRKWLAERKTSSLVVSGDPEWLVVTLPGKSLQLELPLGEARADYAELLRTEAQRLSVDLENRTRTLVIPGLDVPVVVAISPEELMIPGEPSELSRHYLGWLARGLGRTQKSYRTIGDPQRGIGTLPDFARLQQFAFHADAISQTTMMLGSWRSPQPISFARLLLGTVRLYEAVDEGDSASEAIDDAVNILNSSQKMLRKESEPELVSFARVNAAMALLLSNNDEEDLMRLRRELLSTAAITDNQGKPPLGARLALLNLEVLEYAGLL